MPVIMKTIPFNKPFVVGKELYYIAQAVIEHRRLSGGGGLYRSLPGVA